MRPDDERARFAEIFDELSPRVYAYARRQCDPVTAQDVVSDTFPVAWRRRRDVPDSPLPWLLVVAPGPGQDPEALTGAAFLTVMTGEQVVDSLPTIPKDCRR